MCFSDQASMFSFFIGVFSSLFLIIFGVKQLERENIVYGLLMLYVSFMQLFDYMIWIDQKGTLGLNRIASIVAPIFNYSQPLFLYLLKNIFFPAKWVTIDNGVFLLNSIYFVLFINGLSQYYQKEKMIILEEHSHLVWKWLKHMPTSFYLTLFSINCLFKGNFYYNVIFLILGSIFSSLSHSFYKYSPKEIWCVTVLIIPLLLFLYGKVIINYNFRNNFF